MSKKIKTIVVGITALALFAGVADAETTKYKKRRGFFESLFGLRSDVQSPPVFAPDNTIIRLEPSRKRRPAFDVFGNLIKYKDNSPGSNRGIKVSYGDQQKFSNKSLIKKPVFTTPDYAEPEPLPGLGMGTLVYQPPLVAPVFDAAFVKSQTDNADQEAIRLVLADRSTDIRAVEAERKAILAYYSANEFKPLWIADGHITDRAVAALKILSQAESEGLVSTNYLPPILDSFSVDDPTLGGSILKLAAFDVGLTAKLLKYARHLSGGQFDPARLSLYYDIKTSPVGSDAALRVLAHSPYIAEYLSGIAPKQPQYAMFKEALSKLSGPSEPVEQVADGPRVKSGGTDARIPAIRAKLALLGYLTADDAINSNEELLDKALSAALKKFQAANKVKQTGNLDSATVAAFNTDHSQDDRQRLIYSMERLRWLPKSMGARYVFVNQPAFEVNVMDGGKSVWNSRVIVGRPLTQTYSFYDSIETVVFNPTWGVPASIIVNEYGPKSRKDPGYLDRNGFKVVDSKGQTISSRDINWWTMGQAPSFGVQQPAGDGNALGEIKFLFPNSHDIYMHDTPTRNLFTESMRAFSHGCVRVQNPREFASVLLGWNGEKVAANIEQGDSHSVNLPQKVPVYLTYFTAWPNADGKIQYYSDIYGRDSAMAKAFAYDPNRILSSSTDKIVQSGEIIGDLTQN